MSETRTLVEQLEALIAEKHYLHLTLGERAVLARAAERIRELETDRERLEDDAGRWQYVRRFLEVDGDQPDEDSPHVQWVNGERLTDEIPALGGWTHTVESIIDAARTATRPEPTP